MGQSFGMGRAADFLSFIFLLCFGLEPVRWWWLICELFWVLVIYGL
jgi:hypothetical protein